MQQINIYNSQINSCITSDIQLLVGEEVFKLQSEPAFQEGWDYLYDNCSWCTVFQSRAFVESWYNVYKDKYTPIIVKSEKEGKLTGLLTLVLSKPNVIKLNEKEIRGKIVGAGQYEAEYQTWISEIDNDKFINKALTLILKRFPHCNIFFRFLPPLVPLEILKKDKNLKNSYLIHTTSRPLLELTAPDISKLFQKREYRNKLNRLKKLGKLTFEQIINKTEFYDILKELIIQYDFRQGAMFNKNQFRENPLKAQFLLAMFEQNLLHVSVLKVNDAIVASIVAVTGKGCVHLGGINIHTPFEAKFYSPGFVHFIMLSQQLTLNGIKTFDLTPGGDYYKERMANNHDEVYELIVSNNLFFKIKKLARSKIHSRLCKAGIRPMTVDLSIKRMRYLIKGRIKIFTNRSALHTLLIKIKNSFHSKVEIFSIDTQSLNHDSAVLIKFNSLSDLLDYAQQGLWPTRWEFLKDAMRRLERGECSYTWSQEGILLACVWLSGLKPDDNTIPADSAVLQGLYYHSKGYNQLHMFLQSAAAQVIRKNKLVEVFIEMKSYNSELRSLLSLKDLQKAEH